LQSTNFNEIFSMKFYPYKRTTIINNLSPSKLFKFLEVMEINHMNLKFCSLSHCVTIMLIIMNFWDCKMFFQEKCTWAQYIFNHLTTIIWFSKLIKNCCHTKGFLKTFINLLVNIYNIKVRLWINSIFMIFITYFSFQTQTISIWYVQ